MEAATDLVAVGQHGAQCGQVPRDAPTKLEKTMPHAFALGGLELPTSAAGRGAESYEGCGGERRNLNVKRREDSVRKELLA